MFTCAASAGAHAGLVPVHLNGEPRLGAAFAVAVAVLVTAATAVALRPDSRATMTGAGLVLITLMIAYLASRSTGLPVLDPEPEAFDAVGIATNLVGALGVAVALRLIRPAAGHDRSTHLREVSR